MRVELLTIGDELLLGDTVNGNAAWLGRRLAEIGLRAGRSLVVGDELSLILESIHEALARSDVLITTGGLGPTHDDLTRDALARASESALVRDPELERRLRERTAAAGRPLREMALRMADVPEGAAVLDNPVGSAPGLRVAPRATTGVVYALPGVPHEMRAIMDEHVLPELAARVSGPLPAVRHLRTATVWESVLASRLAPVETMEGIRLAYLPGPAEVGVRITAIGPDAAGRVRAAEERARELLGPALYGTGDDRLDHAVHRLLAERSATVATAESLTGGALGEELTRMPGSSATYAGGVVAYATALKHSLLGVPERLLRVSGAVHPAVAAAMATGVRDRLGADYGLAVTGVAGPEPQDGRPVGTVFIGVAGPGDEPVVVAPRLPLPPAGPRARSLIREMTVRYALDLLRRELLGVGERDDWGELRQDREDFT